VFSDDNNTLNNPGTVRHCTASDLDRIGPPRQLQLGWLVEFRVKLRI